MLAVSACGSVTRQACQLPDTGDRLYVIEQGWHVEIGIPVAELHGNMAYFREIFPGARVIMFGYGKKTFFTAPAATLNEYLLGPFPGAAVIQAVGLSVTPLEAYPPENIVTLLLPPHGGQALTAYIWQDIIQDASKKPQMVAISTNPAGVFYAAQSQYKLFHTCNTWAANALHIAGLSVAVDNVIFSNQVMTQVEELAEKQCQVLR